MNRSLVVFAALLFTGCSSNHTTPPAAVTPTPTPGHSEPAGEAAPKVDGTTWQLASAKDDKGQLINALVKKPGKPVTLKFQGNRLAISETCNQMSGQYTLKNNLMQVSNLMSTRMACEPPLMEAERAIAHQVEGTSTLVLEDAQLVMRTNKGATLTFDKP